MKEKEYKSLEPIKCQSGEDWDGPSWHIVMNESNQMGVVNTGKKVQDEKGRKEREK
jgi:hypothetical protein